MPEISVIVPVYKAEQYLHRCVDSILAQTFTDFELILVDDGSPDLSGEICDAYAEKDARVRAIHKENGGVSSARNMGLDLALGKWISFVDSDDHVSERYLQDLFEPDYDLTVSGYAIESPAGEFCETVSYPPARYKSFQSQHFAELLERQGKDWLYICCCRLFRRDIIEKGALRFDLRYHSGEDTIFMATYVTLCNSINIISAANYYYIVQGSGTLSSTLDIDFLEGMLETEAIVAQTMEARFKTTFPRKTKHELSLAYAGYLGDISSTSQFSFAQKYKTLRYLFKNPYFIHAARNPDIYFSGVSKGYRILLRSRSPLLMLFALRVLAWIKHK